MLQDVSFTIEEGETIAVVGHTGAGKTTLDQPAAAFLRRAEGRDPVGGVDVSDCDLHELRQQFGIVLQDPYLFTDHRGQHPPGDEGSRDAAISKAADEVNLSDYIDRLPDGYETPVQSAAQDSRPARSGLMSFARALAHNPRILVLDEATSSVDTETEIRVREASAGWSRAERRSSSLTASRRFRRADRIFVMHKGKLRETGTHQQLLACAESTGSYTSSSTRTRNSRPRPRFRAPKFETINLFPMRLIIASLLLLAPSLFAEFRAAVVKVDITPKHRSGCSATVRENRPASTTPSTIA